MSAQGDALDRLRRRNHDLIWAAQGLFLASAHLLERSGSIMLLTDAKGVVLEVAGDVRTREVGHEVHLAEGGHWHEGVIGTNGIGTALATRAPAQVHAAEHFCEGIKHWTCAGAPVFMPGTDQILGVIDLSGPPSTFQRSSLMLAVAAAREIEAALAERAGRERMQLLEAGLTYSREAAGLIVLDRHAQLIRTIGSVPPEWSVGTRMPGFEPGHQVDEWARCLPVGLRPEWLHPVNLDGVAIGALLVMPRRAGSGAPSNGLALPPSPWVSAAASSAGSSASPTWLAASTSTPSSAPSPSSGGHGGGGGSDGVPPRFGKLVGRSPALREAIERARLLAGKRVAVLIQGETGVGKELFALALHGDEARSGPFVTFNCAATTKELIGSELFGHVRGAYTGATTEGRAGRFELAHGGTLCLDEIGELPLDLQPVLLRVLEEGIVYRLGEAKPRRVDVRLLAMTNRDLLEEVEAGRFRRDLYHRIGVTKIRVPPLRDRAEDVDLLTEHFVHQLALRHRVAGRHFGPEVMAAMRAYPWPGNVRELRNVVESLLLTSNGSDVSLDELPEELLASTSARTPTTIDLLPTSLEESERLTIMRAVQSVHGNLAQAARALRISRSTLYRKVERYHLHDIVRHGDDGEHEPGTTH